MNPMGMLQIKKHLEKFNENHPRVVQFFHAVPAKIEPDSVIEVVVRNPQGEEISTNMKVKEDDIELIRQLQQMAR